MAMITISTPLDRAKARDHADMLRQRAKTARREALAIRAGRACGDAAFSYAEMRAEDSFLREFARDASSDATRNALLYLRELRERLTLERATRAEVQA